MSIALECSFRRNPFYLLGATTRDGQGRIFERVQQRAAALDPHLFRTARSNCRSRSRLSDEVSWLPGVPPDRAIAAVEILSGDSWTTEFQLPPLARANALAGRIESSPIQEADVVRIILELASSADKVDPEVLLREINDDRSVANVPLVEDIDLIRSELAERQRHYRHLARRLLDDFPTKTLVGLVTELAEKATEGAQKRAPTLVEDIVEDYETAAQAFMDGERHNIRKLLTLIQIRAKRGEREFDGLVESLRKTLANWNYVNKPIQVINWGKGLDHTASRRLALHARALCAELRSRDGLAHTADKISECLNDCARPSEPSVQPSTVSSIARAAEDKCRKEPSADLDDFSTALLIPQRLRGLRRRWRTIGSSPYLD